MKTIPAGWIETSKNVFSPPDKNPIRQSDKPLLNQLERNLSDAEQRKINRDRDTGALAFMEPDSSDGALGALQIQKGTGELFLVSVTSIRKRLIDTDNLAAKFHVDLCRYAGLIPDDSPDKTQITVGQRKAEKGEQERTEILIERL